MTNEQLRMQMLSSIITEGEYKAKLEENRTPKSKKKLNENFVGIGMVGNIFDREKTDYEIAFEYFSKPETVNEEMEESNIEEELPGMSFKDAIKEEIEGILSQYVDDINNTRGISEDDLDPLSEDLLEWFMSKNK
jgi:hypothetical protein